MAEVPAALPAKQPADSIRSAILSAVDVSLFAGLYFLARFTFYDSYFGALGVPTDLDLVPPVSVPLLAISVAALFGAISLIGQLLGPDRRSRTPIRKSLVDTISWAVGIFYVHSIVKGYLGHPSRVLNWIALAVLGLVTFVDWLLPVFLHWRTPGYIAKLDEFWKPREPKKTASPQLPRNLFDVLFEWGGSTVRIAVYGGALALAGGHFFGHKAAVEKRSWVEVVHPALPTMAGDKHWIMLSRMDSKLWVAPVTGDGKFQPDIRAVSVDAPDCGMKGITFKVPLAFPE